ncbi:MAG TPA: pyridoxal-phosphate dependent enzyme [Ignavibacteriaceae bacterium]|nr:pyridoxal-phosphate dependent enzyme [Ignavibacteriaceae bacterium]
MNRPQKIKLAFTPTPVQEIKFEERKFLVKRDDMSGIELSGNKVRKLEYLLYQAKKEKAKYIFTCGGDQSNHARATAIAAAGLGMKTRLYLWGKEKPGSDGNLFLDKLSGSEIFFVNKHNYDFVNEIMQEESEVLSGKGKKVFVIPEGGSTTLGIWGYISFIEELKKQIDLKNIEGILIAAGTGGTAAGILSGLALYHLNLKVFAVNVLYPAEIIRKKILQLAEGVNLDYKLKIKIVPGQLEIMDGYSEEGYKKISVNKLELINKFFKETGILLDPAYTGKAFYAYHENFIQKNKRAEVLFLHTGGLYGVFGKRKEYLSSVYKTR